MNVKSAIKSMRLRTLPLSLSGVCLGILLACADYPVRLLPAMLVIITTVCLQIISNLSNELGDVLHGTDNEERIDPTYGLNGGGMTVREMKRLIIAIVVMCCLSGLAMIYSAFGTLFSATSLLLILLGAAAIVAAMRYTLGKDPYGYRGLGDLFVFIFFGLVSVLGGYFVVAGSIRDVLLLLPASSIGFFSIGVLNVNNIRDMKTDAETRVTVALKLGRRNAQIYQTALIALGWAAMILFCILRSPCPWRWLFILTLPLFIRHLKGIWTLDDEHLDPMLPLLVMSSFAFSLLSGFGYANFLI